MMLGQLTASGRARFELFGDWTDRIAKGELPHATPPRPQGVERNIVVTLRDWMNEKHYLHDLISSDRRNPTVNANGPLFGSPEYSSDMLPILDPVKNTATTFKAPVRDADMPLSLGPGHAAALDPLMPSAVLGQPSASGTRASTTTTRCSIATGRLWLAAAVRGTGQSGVLQGRARIIRRRKPFPLDRAVRHLAVFDPKTQKYTFVDTCFGTHHLQFGYDANDTLWTSGGGPGGRLAEHEGLRRDRRCGEGAGLDGAGARHERQRQARRVRRTGRSRSIRRRTSASTPASTP